MAGLWKIRGPEVFDFDPTEVYANEETLFTINDENHARAIDETEKGFDKNHARTTDKMANDSFVTFVDLLNDDNLHVDLDNFDSNSENDEDFMVDSDDMTEDYERDMGTQVFANPRSKNVHHGLDS
ncbi:hypothetical protein QVD17_41633 [Tagetes erecta]|uniref:Uncharacterized protein n=1 Tax=Tagetes erecta TaxID=13708 RepID=A0AAD8NDU6_TARER|nr:hypothetical protein QVD17_41633 [Tagetes erecta]